jgi:threonine 3-dehydrogenase
MITGCGPLGLMAIALAKISGAHRIIATDISHYRLELAQQMGADLTFDATNKDWKDVVRKRYCSDHGVDVHIEMSGASEAIIDGFELVRPGGNVILMGLPKKPVVFDFTNLLVAKGVTVHGLVGRRMYETWDYALRLLGGSGWPGPLNLRPIITHRFMLQDFDKAMRLIDAGECGKVVLFMDEESLQRSYEEDV